MILCSIRNKSSSPFSVQRRYILGMFLVFGYFSASRSYIVKVFYKKKIQKKKKRVFAALNDVIRFKNELKIFFLGKLISISYFYIFA